MPDASSSRSPVRAWFEGAFPRPTPAQAKAWPRIARGENVLLASPTGTGKTLAAFLSTLEELAQAHEQGCLGQEIHTVYISPLRALTYDLEKNLRGPLQEIYRGSSPIRVGLRTGDTTANEREKQFRKPPHVLLTTPESLCLLLTQPRWLPKLATTRRVIVDEIHALAENKRGAHLSLSLERLDHLTRSGPDRGKGPRLQRVGLSATVAPLLEMARFLAGTRGACSIVDVTAAKRVELKVYSPLGRNPYPPSGYTGVRLIRELGRLVKRHRTTLVFTNTRSGAEAATFWLRQTLPELAERIACHHASLDRDVRQEVEDSLKRGELRAVVCSTSLELGIDIGSIDLVVMLAAPKGVSRALQRAGRSGHRIDLRSRGLLMATNLNDLVECCATALLARARQLDPVRIPQAPLDVLAQHLASMGCSGYWTRAAALDLVRRAYPYRDLAEADFNDTLDYLAGGGRALRQQYAELFGKITLDDTGFQTRPDSDRRQLLQNIGVIPSEGVVLVKLRQRPLGTVEETFIRQLAPGDVFILAGRPVRLERTGLMECSVSQADQALPTVPRWNANKMPLTNKVAREIVAFRSELRARFEQLPSASPPLPPGFEAEQIRWIARRLRCGPNNARCILKTHLAQHRLSEIPTADSVLVEDYLAIEENPIPARSRGRRRSPAPLPAARHCFFHTLVGRAANEALARVVALRLSRRRGGNAVATPDDYGFVLTLGADNDIGADDLPELLDPAAFEADLDRALARSDLLKYHFRNAAQTGLMVYRNYFGEQKSVRKLQWSAEVIYNVLREHEPDHVLLREARRDAFHTYLDVDGALDFLNQARGLPKRVRRVDQVPPLSFALFATKIKEALLVEDPRETLERLYNLWWTRLESQANQPPEAASPSLHFSPVFW